MNNIHANKDKQLSRHQLIKFYRGLIKKGNVEPVGSAYKRMQQIIRRDCDINKY